MIAIPPPPAARASDSVEPVCVACTVKLSPAVTFAPLATLAVAVFSVMATAIEAPSPNLPRCLEVVMTLSTGVSSFNTAIKRPDASTAVFEPSAFTLVSVIFVASTATSLVAVVVVLSPNSAVTSLILLMPMATAPERPIESSDPVPTPDAPYTPNRLVAVILSSYASVSAAIEMLSAVKFTLARSEPLTVVAMRLAIFCTAMPADPPKVALSVRPVAKD